MYNIFVIYEKTLSGVTEVQQVDLQRNKKLEEVDLSAIEV